MNGEVWRQAKLQAVPCQPSFYFLASKLYSFHELMRTSMQETAELEVDAALNFKAVIGIRKVLTGNEGKWY